LIVTGIVVRVSFDPLGNVTDAAAEAGCASRAIRAKLPPRARQRRLIRNVALITARA
jgi:hypothetical protein